ncbi:S1/P1 nuclease [Legionella worsleiensis]|uniref:3'-nucleotidase/nuclease n=2 Tax=Legionella worsleiensis TaxID=45076 RepID=A0A0W1AJF7_9GAMM|nr:3'-nucleotidase/nuclease [Legionella worsleiensis]STY30119.1 3'-nucleotidase/nuclease [Legionella worsleiensis]
MMKRFVTAFLFTFCCVPGFSWNATGHQLVAQVAYDHLTPEAKKMCALYNKAYNQISSTANFIQAASWLDTIRTKDIHWFDSLHYKDIPFSPDGTMLPPKQEINALWGIKQAITVLSSEKSSLVDKGLSLRILTHLVGDVHQPLHTITRVTKKQPKGDLGGNLFLLAHNPIGDNLHKYWDNGAGILIGKNTPAKLRNKARQLEKRWSCSEADKVIKPQEWIKSSHQLALTRVYTLKQYQVPDKRYQMEAQTITQKQLFFAGCRLANVLNNIATLNPVYPVGIDQIQSKG